jgi:hypothetical protein
VALSPTVTHKYDPDSDNGADNTRSIFIIDAVSSLSRKLFEALTNIPTKISDMIAQSSVSDTVLGPLKAATQAGVGAAVTAVQCVDASSICPKCRDCGENATVHSNEYLSGLEFCNRCAPVGATNYTWCPGFHNPAAEFHSLWFIEDQMCGVFGA